MTEVLAKKVLLKDVDDVPLIPYTPLQDYLPLSGGTMTGILILDTSSVNHGIKFMNGEFSIDTTETPENNLLNGRIDFYDTNNTTTTGVLQNRLDYSEGLFLSELACLRNVNGSLITSTICSCINSSGECYGIAPTYPNYKDSSNKICTTAFLKSVLSSSGYGLATYSNSSPGYIRFINGFTIQWGSTTTNNITITLPVTMSNANYAILLGNYDDGSLSGNQSGAWKSKTTTGFYLQFGACDGIDWTVIGF